MDLPIANNTRDEIARILTEVAANGLEHPRSLDAAIDAIGAAFEAEDIVKIMVPIHATDAYEVHYTSGDDWTDESASDMFGSEARWVRGRFVAVDE